MSSGNVKSSMLQLRADDELPFPKFSEGDQELVVTYLQNAKEAHEKEDLNALVHWIDCAEERLLWIRKYVHNWLEVNAEVGKDGQWFVPEDAYSDEADFMSVFEPAIVAQGAVIGSFDDLLEAIDVVDVADERKQRAKKYVTENLEMWKKESNGETWKMEIYIGLNLIQKSNQNQQ